LAGDLFKGKRTRGAQMAKKKVPTPRTTMDFIKVRFTDAERKKILETIERDASDPGGQSCIKRCEYEAGRFLSSYLDNGPAKLSEPTPAVVRKNLKELCDATEQLRKSLDALDATGRSLLRKACCQLPGFPDEFSIESEIMRIMMFQVAAEGVLEEAGQQHDHRPKNMPLHNLAAGIGLGLNQIAIKPTTYLDGIFAKVLRITRDAAQRHANENAFDKEIRLVHIPDDVRDLIPKP
jgi:hypothetical protein